MSDKAAQAREDFWAELKKVRAAQDAARNKPITKTLSWADKKGRK